MPALIENTGPVLAVEDEILAEIPLSAELAQVRNQSAGRDTLSY
jgi:hypothetical protein